MKNFGVISIILFFLMGYILITQTELNGSSQLDFQITIEKNICLEGEPVVIKMSLTNLTDKEIIVAEPGGYFTEYDLQWLEGNIKDVPLLKYSVAALPSSYGIILKEKTALNLFYSLNEKYTYGLPIGTYLLQVKYSVPERYYRCWNGVLYSNTVKFSIVSTPDEEKRAFLLLKKGREIIAGRDNYKAARPCLDELLKKYPSSVYARYARFLKAESCWMDVRNGKQDFEEAIEEFRKFVKLYPDCPYYTERAQQMIAQGLYRLGKTTEARTEFQKLPESYYKQKYLMQLK